MPKSKIGTKEIVYPNRKEFIQLKREIFTEASYQPRNEKFDHIVDIGAYIGLSTLFLAELFPDVLIDAYEPNPEIQNLLTSNTETYENVTVHNKAVTKKGGKVDFYLSTPDQEWYSNSSLYPKSWNNHLLSKKVTVESISLNEILNKISGSVLLKIDVEGYETSLINEEINLSDVSEIFIEYHTQNSNRLRRMVKLLQKLEYELTFINAGSELKEMPADGLFLIHAVRD